MSASESSATAVVEPAATTANQAEKPQRKPLPPHAVILHNDDLNGFDYVVGVLRKIFHYPLHKATKLTLEAHELGRSVVWSGPLEVAELKADQIRSCGADPRMKARGAGTLRVSVEPLPG